MVPAVVALAGLMLVHVLVMVHVIAVSPSMISESCSSIVPVRSDSYCSSKHDSESCSRVWCSVLCTAQAVIHIQLAAVLWSKQD